MQRNAIYVLLLMVAGLVALGLVMLFSTSAFAQDSHGDIYYFVKRQGLWLVIGLMIGIAIAMIDYHFWMKWWWVVFALAVLLLVCCFVPHIGMRINGSHRWIKLGMVFQPSELAKIASILFLSWWYSRTDISFHTFKDGLLIPMGALSVLMALIVIEVDMGNTALIGGTALAMMIAAGAALRWLMLMLVTGLGGIAFLAFHISERNGRMLAFLNP